jgi:L-alanine-DL-glutamate epimerase-like enolase superfamily enzyme
MQSSRRKFFSNAVVGGLAAKTLLLSSCNSEASTAESATSSGVPSDLKSRYARLDEILKQPVLKKEMFTAPIIIKTLELLYYKGNFLCRVRSADGAEGMSVGHPFQQKLLNGIFVKRLQPFFIGKDARELETLIKGVYQANYKLQGLALWIPLATIEFAILDLLGHVANKSIGQLIGEIHNPQVMVYSANSDRDITVEETMERIQKQVQESKAKAIKLKIGGRMHHVEYPVGRSEKLIPMVRKTYGDDMVLYADSNSSYTVDEAIRIGKILEEYHYEFYEEPVPFDQDEGTKQVADALSIPIAGGEQEPSLNHFRWLIANDALQIVQPDQFYFGGMIRSMQVARMANAFGKLCTPHMSEGGLGYLYVMHFVSAIPNAGKYHEFKGLSKNLPFTSKTSSLLPSEDGIFKVPTGPGLGIDIDPAFVEKHQIVKG